MVHSMRGIMEEVLVTRGLTKVYRGKRVVNGVNMSVERGDIYGFIGKNGAGKTTLMKMVCGLARVSEGSFELFGSADIGAGRRKVGCVIEQPALYPGMSARENLTYYSKMQGCEKITDMDGILRLVGLADTGKLKAKRFSLGMRQRLSIAVALLGEPEFLVLDEPINGLDPSGIREVRELLLRLHQEKKVTILISSHILGELGKIATKYGIINDGQLLEEFTTEEMEERFTGGLCLQVDDVGKACEILEKQCGIRQYKVQEDAVIQVRDKWEDAAAINERLVTGGVRVSRLVEEKQDMEMYFVKKMGGM